MRRSLLCPTLSRGLLVSAVVGMIVAASTATAQAPPQPTVEHQQLAREVGVWDAEVRFWMHPGAEPMVNAGSETCEMLGGFWLLSKFSGSFGGMPFTGVGQTGYDPETGEYVSTWIDSMTSNVLLSRGTYDVATHTLTLTGEGKDTMTGKPKQIKMTTQYTDEDHKQFILNEAAIGSDAWRKVMEINYVRRGK